MSTPAVKRKIAILGTHAVNLKRFKNMLDPDSQSKVILVNSTDDLKGTLIKSILMTPCFAVHTYRDRLLSDALKRMYKR